jgi:hypothetical protein
MELNFTNNFPIILYFFYYMKRIKLADTCYNEHQTHNIFCVNLFSTGLIGEESVSYYQLNFL